MIAAIQRVAQASVTIESHCKAQIQLGLLVLLGIGQQEEEADIVWLANKIANLRIFDDDNGTMNLSVKEKNGDIILVSQFTLQASTKKGNRPSYSNAATPAIALPIYQRFIAAMEKAVEKPIQTGQFGAYMQVALVNDGPTTILIDTKNKT